MPRHNNWTAPIPNSIFTPPEFAQMLCEWAITSKKQRVLDLGVGEGAITLAAHRRLVDLGASPDVAAQQIFGAEISRPTFAKFQSLSMEKGVRFQNISSGNFFTTEFPKVSCVIGNPQFLRRSKIPNLGSVHRALVRNGFDRKKLPALTDLYVYFILLAATRLKSGGRLAVITSDSWLSTKYGSVLRQYFKDNFQIEKLISLDRNIFHADVKALVTLATKSKPNDTCSTQFARIKNGLPGSKILGAITIPTPRTSDVEVSQINLSTLDASDAWSDRFKNHALFSTVSKHHKIVKLRDLADSRIGLQTLAKDFYVISASEKRLGPERRYLRPLISSARNLVQSRIRANYEPETYLFVCDSPKSDLGGTRALTYIRKGEKKEVTVRGKNKTVVGFHKKDRIKEAGRRPWYNLKTELARRKRSEILVPRIIGKNYRIYWNEAGYVPGEFFIEVLPKGEQVETEVYLALFASSLFEFCLRSTAHLYGGGAYSVFPGRFKELPMIDVRVLNKRTKSALISAYRTYCINEPRGRKQIDKIIYEILDWTRSQGDAIRDQVRELVAAVETFQGQPYQITSAIEK